VSRGTPTLDRRQLLRIFGAVAAAGATGGLAACTADNPTNRERQPSGLTVRIGLVLPSTGPFAGIGQDIDRAFKLYLKKNDNLLGPHTVQVLTADEGESAESAVAAVTGLLGQGVVTVVGVTNPDALPQVSAAVQQRQVPLVAANAAPAALIGALFTWRTSSVVGDAGEALAQYALRVGPRAYVIHDDSSTGTEEAARFATKVEDGEGTVIEGISGSFANKLSDARNRGVDTIFAAYSGAEAAEVLKAHFNLNSSIRLLGPASLTETTDLAAIGPLPQQVYTSSFYAPDLDNDANRRFVTDYHREYSLQATGYAMAAYDSASVLSRVMSLVPGEPTGNQINDFFSELGQIESPRGTWTFNINRSPQQKWYLRRLTLDGRVPSNLLDSDLMVLG